MFPCTLCGKVFSIRSSMNRHLREVCNKGELHKCLICMKIFSRLSNLKRHSGSCRGMKVLEDRLPMKKRMLDTAAPFSGNIVDSVIRHSGPSTVNTCIQRTESVIKHSGSCCDAHVLAVEPPMKRRMVDNTMNRNTPSTSGLASNIHIAGPSNIDIHKSSNSGVVAEVSSINRELKQTSDGTMCLVCNILIPKKNMPSHMRSMLHKNNAISSIGEGVELISTAMKCRIASYRVASTFFNDYKLFFKSVKGKILELISRVISEHKSTKINMEVFSRYIRQPHDDSDIKSFNTSNKVVDMGTDVDAAYDDFVDAMINQSSEFTEKGSGWAIEEILYVEVNISKFSPLRGSSFVRLPRCIYKKRAVVNVRNEDNFCFAWAIMSALFPVAPAKASDVNSYPHYSRHLNLTGITFPVKLKHIMLFEKLNNISVNVYGLESNFKNNKVIYEIVGPLRHTEHRLPVHINLLYVSDDNNGHYCWIKDLSRLVSTQVSIHSGAKYFCDGCLLYFYNAEQLKRHQEKDCNHCATVMPTPTLRVDKFGRQNLENKLKFENIEKQLTVPFVVYADFESILKPIDTCEPDSKSSFTNKIGVHEAYSFAYLIKSSFDDSITKFVTYRGVNAAEEFVRRLEIDLRDLYFKYLKDIVPMEPLTRQEKLAFENADSCSICGMPFHVGNRKVRDHCHITGKVRSAYGHCAAHSICNLHFQVPSFIPIIFHNLTSYDSHLFIKQLCSHGDKIDVIAENKEKYISFTKKLFMHDYVDKDGVKKRKYLKMRFIDSFRFLPDSLQSLADNLSEDHFMETKKHYTNTDTFNLMRQKGVFPYSFVDGIEKLDTTALPSKTQFYDKLNDEHISDEDYGRATRVWDTFNCQNLGEYSDIYLKTDVLLLCDVFENFRRHSLEIYKLDPCHYYTSPGLSWDAMLKYTGVELELLTDIDMLNFFKDGIRGGVSQCTQRKCEANNKYMPTYNPEKPSSFIEYLDATNLYGASMSSSLPTGEFRWLSQREIETFKIDDIPNDGDYGFVFEVDIKYPEALHDKHADLPFLVESITPPKSKSKIPKLIPNLYDKSHYIVHYKNLQQAVKYGLIITKIHRILTFKQSCWLKKYIDLNTKMRNKALSKFEKDLYKLMNNAIFGKTMENVDNHRDIKLVTHWENIYKSPGAGSLIARPNFKSSSIFTEDLVAIHMGKVKVKYFKPIYVGFSILEISKTIIYEFFYGFIKEKFGDKATLLYTDTDSLIIRIETDDFYGFMRENIDKFDTSNYGVNNKFDIPVTESILGRMKDEFPGDIIVCFYGTGAKAYYVLSLNGELKKAKGIKKNVIKRHLCGDDYRQIIENGGTIMRKMNTFKSTTHNIYTEMNNKIALSHHDDKRFLIPNTTRTLPWGHSDICFYQTDPELNVQYALKVIESMNEELSQSSDESDDRLGDLIAMMVSELE